MQRDPSGLPVFIETGRQGFVRGRPTLVFIHGAQHDHFVWQALVARFADPTRNVLAIDLPGHGRSGGVPLPSIEAIADWLIALLAGIGADGTASLCLAGHSMGSLVVLEAAARHPEQVAQLFMIGTALPMPVAPTLLDAARDDEPKAMALINRWSHSPYAWRGAVGGHGLWLPTLNQRIMERQAAGVLFTDLAACNDYRNGPAAARLIACPVTIIAGTADRMTSPRAARRASTLFSTARLVELPGVGHALMAEAPRAVGNVIAAALNS